MRYGDVQARVAAVAHRQVRAEAHRIEVFPGDLRSALSFRDDGTLVVHDEF